MFPPWRVAHPILFHSNSVGAPSKLSLGRSAKPQDATILEVEPSHALIHNCAW